MGLGKGRTMTGWRVRGRRRGGPVADARVALSFEELGGGLELAEFVFECLQLERKERGRRKRRNTEGGKGKPRMQIVEREELNELWNERKEKKKRRRTFVV
jgi:hypothetical protein